MERKGTRIHVVRLIPIAVFSDDDRLRDAASSHDALALSGRAPESIEEFQLPPKTVFDRAMPRYPNVWFHVDTALAPSHRDAVKLVTDALRDSMRLREYFPPFDNPEGCDFEARIEHLQPWEDRTARALQHAHAFHMRYYSSALAAGQLEKVTLNTGELARHVLSVRRERSLRGRAQQPESRRRGSLPDLRPHRRLRQPGRQPGRARARSARPGAPAERHHPRRAGAVRGLRAARGRLDFGAWRQIHSEFGRVSGALRRRNTLRIGVVVITARR